MIDIHTHHPERRHRAIYSLTPERDFQLDPKGCYSLGIHPWRMEEFLRGELCTREELKALLLHPRVLAVGEAGLDKSRILQAFDSSTGKRRWFQALDLFEWHAQLAEEVSKPLVIHCVRAMEELLAVKHLVAPRQRWIVHGFRGKPRQAEQFLNQGFSLSLGGKFHPDTARLIPEDCLFAETDESRLSATTILERIAQARGDDPKLLMLRMEGKVQAVFGEGIDRLSGSFGFVIGGNGV